MIKQLMHIAYRLGCTACIKFQDLDFYGTRKSCYQINTYPKKFSNPFFTNGNEPQSLQKKEYDQTQKKTFLRVIVNCHCFYLMRGLKTLDWTFHISLSFTCSYSIDIIDKPTKNYNYIFCPFV